MFHNNLLPYTISQLDTNVHSVIITDAQINIMHPKNKSPKMAHMGAYCMLPSHAALPHL